MKRFMAVPHERVRFLGGFWGRRLDVNTERTLPHIERMLREGRRFDLYDEARRAAALPHYKIYWESEVAHWIEAACRSLAGRPDPSLEGRLESAIAMATSIQQPDGYLNAYFTFVRPGERWRHLFTCHELYNAGAWIEAAVAHHRATGRRTLLDPVLRYVTCIAERFGRGLGQLPGYDGHPGVELALMKLFHHTSDPRYRELAHFFVSERGRTPCFFDREDLDGGIELGWVQSLRRHYRGLDRSLYEFCQAHRPVVEQREAVGHAVRAMFLYAAMADLAGELGDWALLASCQRLWEDVSGRKLYLTGGVGSEPRIEGFGSPFDLPNDGAYAETCASVGLVFWASRLLALDLDRRYADAIERALSNAIAGSVSLDGESFYYDNPLEVVHPHSRSRFYTCACCPPNVARLFASLGEYLYGLRDNEIAVHLYAESKAKIPFADREVRLSQRTRYPLDGGVILEVGVDQPSAFILHLRLPGWCDRPSLAVNHRQIDLAGCVVKGYARVERRWEDGDRIELDLPMSARRVWAHPLVRQDVGSVAIERGPLVYCLEGADHDVDLHRLALADNEVLEERFDADLLGGTTVVRAAGVCTDDGRWAGLYGAAAPPERPYPLQFVPYALRDNRGSGQMRVWVRRYP